MRARTILIAGCSAALLATPAAMARGGDDGDSKKRPQAGTTAPAATTTAPAVLTPVACVPATPGVQRVSFNAKGRIVAVSPEGLTVKVAKVNGNFRRAAGAGKTFGLYDPAPTTTNLAFVTISDCTRIESRGRGHHGRRKGVSRYGEGCIQIGAAATSWRARARVACVGDRIEVKWKAAPDANIAAGGLGPARKIELKR